MSDEPVRFLCAAADAREAVTPRPAAELLAENAIENPVVESAARVDRRVADHLARGWCLYPPSTVRLDPDGEPPADAAPGTVTVHEGRSSPSSLSVTIETRWRVEVAEGCPVLVTSWAGATTDHVAAELVTAADGPVALGVPVTTDEAVTYDPETPLAQVVPIPRPVLGGPFGAGIPDRATKNEIDRVDRLLRVEDDAYEENGWVEKAPNRLVGPSEGAEGHD